MTKPIFRFAPSPNGYLHLGHAYSALFTWNAAQKAGGEMLLRIEDIDVGRCRKEYALQIYDDLNWLGLTWPVPVRVQSQHFDDYRKASAILEQKNLLYPCFCSRKQVANDAEGLLDPDGAARYVGKCRQLSVDQVAKRQKTGEPFAMRLNMERVIAAIGDIGQPYASLEAWGDVVLVRKDIPTSYHLSVVVDDALQRVSHVTRGMDMYASTAIHIALQKLLGLPTPEYQHHELIKDDVGRKLAKSFQDQSLKALRENGLRLGELLELHGFQTLGLDQIRG